MSRSILKNILLLSLIVFIVGLIVLLMAIQYNNTILIDVDIEPSNTYKTYIGTATFLLILGTIFIVYSVQQILSKKITSLNFESSDHLNS